MSTNQSQSEADSSTNTESQGRLNEIPVLGRVLNNSVVEYKDGNGEYAPRYLLTPLGKSVGRALIAGVVLEVDQRNATSVRAEIATGVGEQIYVSANEYTEVAPSELSTFEVGTPVRITGRPSTFEGDTDSEDEDPTVYTSFDVETIAEVTRESVMKWQADAAQTTVSRAQDLKKALENDVESREMEMWDANYSLVDLGEMFNYAQKVAANAAEALEDSNEDQDESTTESDSEDLETILSDNDVHPPAVETLASHATSAAEVESMSETELLDLPNVGQATAEQVQAIFGGE